MALRPYKFQVVAVVQETDPDGNVIREQVSEPVLLYGCDALKAWADSFPDALDAFEEAAG